MVNGISLLAATEADTSPKPIVHVPLTTQPPKIDGRLDDPCWAYAAVITNFVQVRPHQGAPPTERTELRILYDRDHIYFGVRCWDKEPQKILAKSLRHDDFFASDDTFEIVLDTFNQQREGYFFRFNPAGARSEGLIQNFEEHNPLWDGVWDVKARIDKKGWCAEVVIPFKSLSFGKEQGVWGLNAERIIRRKQETVRWTCISRAKQVSSLPDAGKLVGIQNVHQGKGWEFKPSLALNFTDKEHASWDWEVRPSLDITYHITPFLKANATFYTDFAEAEVDDRIINLTRFPTFFPEKRDFFLQDASLFNFGGLRAYPINPYYSRRIGLDPEGRQLDIYAGGRLTGRLDSTRIGFLYVTEEGYQQSGVEHLMVGRISRSISDMSDLGVLWTYGEPRGPGQAYLGGVDFNYNNPSIFSEKRFVTHLWLMGTYTDQADGGDVAGSVDIDFPNDPFDSHFIFRHIGEDFDPALGFVRRSGIRSYYLGLRYDWHPNGKIIRDYSLGVRTEWITDLDNRLVEEHHDLPYLWFSTPKRDRLFISYNYDRDVVDQPFSMADRAEIPAGDYLNDSLAIKIETSEARPLAAELEYSIGNYYDGTQRKYKVELAFRPNRFVTFLPSYSLREIDMPYGKFDVHLAVARIILALTPDLSWNTLIQYDNLSQNFGINSRIRWTFRPGNDLFLVWTQNYLADNWRFQSTETRLSIKAVLRIRF